MRAGVEVEMLNTEEAPLKINVEADPARQVPEAPPIRIAIGQGTPSIPPRIDMRATYSWDAALQIGELLLRQPGDSDKGGSPMIVGLPIAAIKAGGGSATTTISFYWPAVTAQLLLALGKTSKGDPGKDVEWKLVSATDRRVMETHRFNRSEAAGIVRHPFSDNLIEALCSLSANTPLPWWIPDQDLDALESADASKAQSSL